MAMTPLEIRKAEFRRRMGGYVVDEVRAYLETVAREFEALARDNAALAERIRVLDEKVEDYRRMEKVLQDTLTATQQVAAEMKEAARREADSFLEKSKTEAYQILTAAHDEEARLRRELSTLQGQKIGFVAEFRGLLESYLKMLERIEAKQ